MSCTNVPLMLNVHVIIQLIKCIFQQSQRLARICHRKHHCFVLTQLRCQVGKSEMTILRPVIGQWSPKIGFRLILRTHECLIFGVVRLIKSKLLSETNVYFFCVTHDLFFYFNLLHHNKSSLTLGF